MSQGVSRSRKLRAALLGIPLALYFVFIPSFVRAQPGPEPFIRGDASADGGIDVTDAVVTLGHLFLDGDPPPCADAADSTDDGRLNITDPIYTLNFLFTGGPPPALPHGECGDDPTPDGLGCDRFPPCAGAPEGALILSEILAVNDRSLVDGDREFSDWIELTNVSPEEVDLIGYHLTDEPDDPTRWAFHDGADTRLAPGASIVVFASGRETPDHVDGRGSFHTSFRLDRRGEYLALVHPDGETVVSAFAPRYPEQRVDVSYGVVPDVVAPVFLVSEEQAARWTVADGPLAPAWTSPEYDDSGWEAGRVGLGYETAERGLYTGKFETDVRPAMFGRSAALHLRVEFLVEDPSSVRSLTLWMRYDDGFVAWLNGSEVAAVDAAAGRPDADAVGDFVEFDLAAEIPRLVAGRNVLAIRALNADPSSERFLVLPVLEARVFGTSRQYFTNPTPGEPNVAGAAGIVGDTEFSVDRGVHGEPFEVAITTATPGARIRFTTDGTAPSPERGILYERPLRVEGTTVLRAVAYQAGRLPTNVDTHTYVFLSGPRSVLRQPNDPPGYPRSWAGYPADYEMDPEIVDHPRYGGTIADDMKALPALSIVAAPADLFGRSGLYTNPQSRGLAWERPASLEFFSPDGREEFQVDCGLRIQGGAGRRPEHPKHSFRTIFRKRYGAGKLEYDLFRDQRYGEWSTDSFDKLSIRGGFNNTFPHWYDEQAVRSQYIRDQWARDLQMEMGHRSTLGRFVHLYLNGMYWGLYNLGERPDDDFAADYFGGEDDEWDVIKNGGPQSGSGVAWSRLLALANRDVSTPEAYSAVLEYVDVVNLIDYVLENFYFGNTDWDHNNWVGLRRRQEGAPFRFFAWDSEFAVSLPPGAQPNRWDTIIPMDRTRTDTPDGPTHIFQRLRGNEEFRMLLADRIYRHCYNGGVLTPERVTEIWMRRADEVDRAVVGESARWGDFRRDVSASRDPRSVFPLFTRDEHYLTHQRWVLGEYFPVRTEVFVGQLRRARHFPDVEPPRVTPYGGAVSRGLRATLTTVKGRAYYTVDGTDPRLPGGEVSPDALLGGDAIHSTVLSSDAEARVLVPPGGDLGLGWTAPGFDDSGWRSGPAAVGYDERETYRELILTDVEGEMNDVSSSVYIRIQFDVSGPLDFDFLTLRMKFDDGFVAYLNGEEVTSRNAPETPLWNSAATRLNADSRARVFEDLDISEHRGLIRQGSNLLAIHGLNRRVSDTDFLIVPELTIGSAAVTEIPIAGSTVVKARRLDDGEWSPLAEAVFTVDTGLRITELMYHPPPTRPQEGAAGYDDGDDFEFIELVNMGPEPVSLKGVVFVRGVELELGDVSLARAQRAVLVSNRSAFEARYGAAADTGVLIAGEYSGRLSNGGERVLAGTAPGDVILDFTYDDAWYPETDGAGHSLVPVDPDADPSALNERSGWRPSRAPLGSPGFADR